MKSRRVLFFILTFYICSNFYADTLSEYVTQFNQDDVEMYKQHISNADAEEFLRKNIPLFSCPDKDIERAYYFRWWTFRKHIKKTPDGFIITEFLPQVPWSGKYNAICCPAAHHFAEGRWLFDKSYLRAYADYWRANPKDARKYSFWWAHAILDFYKISRDNSLLSENYSALKNNFFAWQASHFDKEKNLFWQQDNRDGMECSISGDYSKTHKFRGYRATINSYMYAECSSLAEMAKILGKNQDADFFSKRATELASSINKNLWDSSARFFKVIPFGRSEFSDVRELHGYTPWLFNIPPAEYSDAWKFIGDEKFFKAPWGLTTAERNHKCFTVSYKGHECQWNGPVWPFSTSITLSAFANFINENPANEFADKLVYSNILKTYAKSHVRKLKNGKNIMWIDENQDPFTGEWIARKRLMDDPNSRREWGERGWHAKQSGKERGKDYNHSQFCNHVISELVGLRVSSDGSIVVNPLVPDSWSYFSLQNVFVGRRLISITFDKSGEKFAQGLNVYVAGELVASSKNIQKLQIKLPKRSLGY